MAISIQPPKEASLRLLLVCILLGAYLLVYINRPQSADGDATLAVATSLLRHGSPDIAAIGHTQWLLEPAGQMGTVGTDGALYAKKGPTPSLLLLPFVTLAHLMPWLSIRATAMLFNPLVTVATALLLFAFIRRLGYRAMTALTTSMIFGLATFAIAYTKTLYGEPLAALLLLLALALAYSFRQQNIQQPLLLSGAALALAIGVNSIYVFYVPVLAVYMFWPLPLKKRAAVRRLVLFGLPVVVALLALAAFNWARFGSPLDSGYHFADGEGFNRPIVLGIYGLILSPFRGLFWFNPVLMLSVPGWFMLRRRASRLAWIGLALVVGQILAFASWWSWHGGVAWGPRFLIPITPLAALFLAPLVELAWQRRKALLALALLLALSFGIQLLGTLFSVFPYNGHLFEHYGTDTIDSFIPYMSDTLLYTPRLSPIFGHLDFALDGQSLEAAWLTENIDLLHLLAALGLILLGVALWRLPLAGRRVWLLVAIGIIASLNVVVARQQIKPEQQSLQALEDMLQPPGVALAATALFENGLLDVESGRIITMNAPTAPTDFFAQQMWDYALRQDARLWYVTWFGVADELNWQEQQLWQEYNFIAQTQAAGHRALYFDLAPAPQANQPGGWTFGPLRLVGYGTESAPDGLRLSVQWSADEPIAADFSWFIHLVRPDATIAAQQDRPPGGGFLPTSAWNPGEIVTDRLFFPLKPDTDTSGWRLRVGFVNPLDGARLAASAPDGAQLADGFALLPLPRD